MSVACFPSPSRAHNAARQGQVHDLVQQLALLLLLPDLRDQRVLHVDDDVVGLGHRAVEVHPTAQGAHFAVAAHELALGDEYRRGVLAEVLRVDHVVVALRQDALEELVERLLVLLAHLRLDLLLLGDEVVDGVAVHTREAGVLDLGLQQVDEVAVELAVHQQDVVALVLRGLDPAVLLGGLGGVEVDHVLILVGLVRLDGRAVVLQAEVLAFGVLEEGELEGALAELLVGEHAVLDEELDVVPLLLELLALLLEDLLQAVRCSLKISSRRSATFLVM